MARLKIDLLPKEAEEIKKVNKAVKALKLFNEVVAGVLVLVVIALFGVYFWFNYQLQTVIGQVNAVTTQIEQSGETELKYRYYQELLNKANDIVKKRTDYRGIYNDLFALFPAEVLVGGVSLEGDVVVFNGNVSGIQSFSRLIDEVKKIESGQNTRFGNVALNKVSRGGDASYLFTLELGLKTK